MMMDDFLDMIGHYDSKLAHARDEWISARRQLDQLYSLLGTGWQGRAGQAALLKTEELGRELDQTECRMEELHSSLAALGLALEEGLSGLSGE